MCSQQAAASTSSLDASSAAFTDNNQVAACAGNPLHPQVLFIASTMKAHIPGTSEHKLKKEEQKLRQDEKNMQTHEQDLLKHENNLRKQAAKEEAKDIKNMNKQQDKLHKQEAKAATAADKVAGRQSNTL